MVNFETVLAITSVVLALVSFVLSLVFYFASSRLHQETREYLVKLQTITEGDSGEKTAMIWHVLRALIDGKLSSKDTLAPVIVKRDNSECEVIISSELGHPFRSKSSTHSD